MRKITFDGDAFEQFTNWATENKKIHARIVRLLKEIDRSPHTGLASPNRYGMTLVLPFMPTAEASDRAFFTREEALRQKWTQENRLLFDAAWAAMAR